MYLTKAAKENYFLNKK